MKYEEISNEKPFMGLFNKECKKRDYYCKFHNVWLSSKDVERKKCFNKPTFDMISTYMCPYLFEAGVEND